MPTCSTRSSRFDRSTETWIQEHNQERPHDSLGCVPPSTYMPRQTDPESALPLCA